MLLSLRYNRDLIDAVVRIRANRHETYMQAMKFFYVSGTVTLACTVMDGRTKMFTYLMSFIKPSLTSACASSRFDM
jgi:hypothetical protein